MGDGGATSSSKADLIYQLGSNDNPGNIITTIKLRGENYDEWAREIRTALNAKRKLGFLDGTITKPTDADKLADWSTVHSMLVSWIRNTIEPGIRSTLSCHEDAHELWEAVKERFGVVNGTQICFLKAAISECKQKGEAICDYFGRLSHLWDELAAYEVIPTCKTGGVGCEATRYLLKMRQEDRLHQFLIGLDPVYGPVRSNLLGQDPLPSVNRAYQSVVQEERLINGATSFTGREAKDNTVAYKIQSDSRIKPRAIDNGNKFCNHCNRDGHDESTCFQLVGFPDWWGDRPKGGRGPGRGTAAGGRSFAAVGRGTGRGRGCAGQTVRANSLRSGQQSRQGASSSDNLGTSGLSPAQLQQILEVLNTSHKTQDMLHGKNYIQRFSWILDTGASHHVAGDISLLNNVRKVKYRSVGLPNGKEAYASDMGDAILPGGFYLQNILYVPALTCNLISMSQLFDESRSMAQWTDKLCIIQDLLTRKVIGVGEREDGLYFFRGVPGSVKVLAVDGLSQFELWHRRLGHPSDKVVQLLPVVSSSRNKNVTSFCDVCPRAKHCRSAFPLSPNKASRIFELVHIDLWGPYKTRTTCGSSYFLTIVDDFSRSVWTYLLKNKMEVEPMFQNFIALVHRQFDQTIKIVRTDNGTEFFSLADYFLSQGMIFETSCVGTPQQNGRVERKHRHILNVARALKFQAHLPIKFWGECVSTACHLINRTPSTLLNNKSPFEILFGKVPVYATLRVFGCLCYAYNHRSKGDKFASRSRKCAFLGYPFGKKGWKVYDLETHEHFVSRDVQFFESNFPFQHFPMVQNSASTLPTLETIDWSDDDICLELNPSNDPPDVDQPHVTGEVGELAGVEILENLDGGEGILVQENIIPHEQIGAEEGEPVIEDELEELGRGKRTKVPSSRLQDYVTNTVRLKSPSTCTPLPSITSSGTTPYPLTHFINSERYSAKHQLFVAAITASQEPKSFKEAMRHEGWRQAMADEINALEEQGTWVLETLPPGKRALGSKWVYKEKYDEKGVLQRLKARLVAYGNRQIEGIDYTETFAPVAKMVTVRTFLAVAAVRDWEVHQMDVHNAFLHGDLTEEVYMKIPPGFDTGNTGKVCRMKKSLYGLKQAPRCWFAKLGNALKDYGFKQSYSDYSLFVFSKGTVNLHVLVYVDDLIIAGNSGEALREFKTYLSSCFKMKDLGMLKYFLGLEVARSKQGFFVCQRKYTLDIISETGLLGAKPADFPIEQHHRLATAESPALHDVEKYRRLVGRLIYLSVTRPDLAYSVHILSQFMQQPLESHWEAALRVVRYLKKHPGQGILLRSDSSLKLEGWCDSDWASCPVTRRSLSGWFVLLGHSPISWKTKKQPTVSRSSAEAEYRAMAAVTCELKWLKQLLGDLGVDHFGGMRLHCDSQSALYIAQNPVFHERTKHIEADCHFIRDAVTSGLISPSYVHTSEQLADFFTKALGKSQFEKLLFKLGIADIHAPT